MKVWSGTSPAVPVQNVSTQKPNSVFAGDSTQHNFTSSTSSPVTYQNEQPQCSYQSISSPAVFITSTYNLSVPPMGSQPCGKVAEEMSTKLENLVLKPKQLTQVENLEVTNF